MANTALTQLQDQIEAVRREAYEAGYAAAMQAVREFAGHPAGTAAPATAASGRTRPSAQPAPAAKPGPRRRGAAKAASSGTRPQRGTNARLIIEVLKAMPSGTARPADIRKALESDKGVSMAFTSIRHALGQLAARNEVAALDDGKTWRYVGP
ncbi:MAG TPA: hypothetical protein VG651_07150 [Stellaceae bacterium]|nr:hypothetical protein [Stellaceae bacterium]